MRTIASGNHMDNIDSSEIVCSRQDKQSEFILLEGERGLGSTPGTAAKQEGHRACTRS